MVFTKCFQQLYVLLAVVSVTNAALRSQFYQNLGSGP